MIFESVLQVLCVCGCTFSEVFRVINVPILIGDVLQAEEVKSRFGGVDILVNNAGVVCGKPLLECQASEIRHTIDVNLMSQFWASCALYFSCPCN